MNKSIVIAVMLTASFVSACPDGCEEYRGICACDQKAPEVKPSDELPSRNRVPAYERGDVKPDMPPSELLHPTPDDFTGKLPNSGVPQR